MTGDEITRAEKDAVRARAEIPPLALLSRDARRAIKRRRRRIIRALEREVIREEGQLPRD